MKQSHQDEYQTTQLISGKIGNITYSNAPIEIIPEEYRDELLKQKYLHDKININKKIGKLVTDQAVNENYQTWILTSLLIIVAKQYSQTELNNEETKFLRMINETGLNPLSLIGNTEKIIQTITDAING